jgi:predicted membrane protein
MKNKTVLWILVVIFAIMTVIDFIDGNMPKLISSLSITLALILFAVSLDRRRPGYYHIAAYGLLLVALIAFAYRITNWFP